MQLKIRKPHNKPVEIQIKVISEPVTWVQQYHSYRIGTDTILCCIEQILVLLLFYVLLLLVFIVIVIAVK